MAARCGAWSPGARRRRSSTEAIGKLNFVLLPRKSSDPSKPVRLAPFESTGAGTIIAPTVRLSIEEIVARPRFIAVAWRWPGDVSVRPASARSALRERARLRRRRRFPPAASDQEHPVVRRRELENTPYLEGVQGADFEKGRERGRAFSLDEAVDYALSGRS